MVRAHDQGSDKVDSLEAATLGLNQAISENRPAIIEISRNLDAIIKHLDVPYKPPLCFSKD